MRAVVLEDAVTVRSDYPEPRTEAGEVSVQVLCAGICETDLQLIRGYMGFRGVLGHEFVGIAESGPFAGRRVVGEINCACRTMRPLSRGLPTHCSSRTVLGILNHDGAFADTITVPQDNLHVVPENMPTDIAVFTEPVAAAFQIPAQIQVQRTIASSCSGTVGSAICAHRSLPASRTTCSSSASTRASSRCCTRSASPRCCANQVEARRDADIVVDCTGSDTGLPTALKLVRPRGTIVLKTTVAGEQTLAWAPFVIDEITLVGSRCGPFDQALKALAEGRVSVAPLISDRFDLSEGANALEHARTKPVLKVLLDVRARVIMNVRSYRVGALDRGLLPRLQDRSHPHGHGRRRRRAAHSCRMRLLPQRAQLPRRPENRCERRRRECRRTRRYAARWRRTRDHGPRLATLLPAHAHPHSPQATRSLR
jgi:threonine dehydrogenase-like Zn-dependent dehydrogenase